MHGQTIDNTCLPMLLRARQKVRHHMDVHALIHSKTRPAQKQRHRHDITAASTHLDASCCVTNQLKLRHWWRSIVEANNVILHQNNKLATCSSAKEQLGRKSKPVDVLARNRDISASRESMGATLGTTVCMHAYVVCREHERASAS